MNAFRGKIERAIIPLGMENALVSIGSIKMIPAQAQSKSGR
jgi:hypothetical protein